MQVPGPGLGHWQARVTVAGDAWVGANLKNPPTLDLWAVGIDSVEFKANDRLFRRCVCVFVFVLPYSDSGRYPLPLAVGEARDCSRAN